MNPPPYVSLNNRQTHTLAHKGDRALRKLIVTNIVSLDGYYEGPGHNVMVLPMDHRFDEYNLERIRVAETLVLGGTSYLMFKGFWPAMADNPDANPVHREFAQLENAIDKVVVSDSLTDDDTDPWRDTTRIVRRAEAHKTIADLRRGDGGDLLMFGSHRTWNDLLGAGLVDELHLIVGATILGDGTPIFVTPPPAGLHLLGTEMWDDSDNVLVRYAVRQPSSEGPS
jgi:dihydrofolate reductase